MLKRSVAVCFISMLATATSAAQAVTVGGATFPDSVTVAGDTLKLNGAGVRVFFAIVNGYASALYVRSPSKLAADVLAEPNPKMLVTRFLHAASVAQLRREFANVHDHYCARNACTRVGEDDYHRMIATLGPVTKDETATYIITDAGFQVLRDDKPVITINDPGYGRVFLEAIVGATSPTPGYRRGLLGAVD